MKRSIFSLFVALALCLSLLPGTALADDPVVSPEPPVSTGYSWYDSNESEFTISSAADLLAFAKIVNGTDLPTDNSVQQSNFSGKTVKLDADINLGTLSNIPNWTPIGTKDHPFQGTFDGQGHTISGLKIDANASATAQSQKFYYGLFGYVEKAENTENSGIIQNLAVSGSVSVTVSDENTSRSTVYVGGVVGYIDGTIQRCCNTTNSESNSVSGSSGSGENSYGTVCVGGVAGCANSGIANCYNTGNVSATGSLNSRVGGVVGSVVTERSSLTNCYNTGKVSFSGSIDENTCVDGVGIAENGVTKGLCFYPTDALSDGGGIDKNWFENGYVAWSLQDNQTDKDSQVWGQTLTGENTDASPILTAVESKRVHRVQFKNSSNENPYQTKYVNHGKTVALPESDPTKEDFVFGGWYNTTEQTGGTQFTAETSVTSDITVYSRWTASEPDPAPTPDPEPTDPTPTPTPSPTPSGGGGSSRPSITVPVFSEVGSVKASAGVKNKTVSVRLSERQLGLVVVEGAETVTVDCTKLKNVTAATLPARLLKTIRNLDAVSLTVALPTGTVSLDSAALNSLPAGKDVTISVKRVSDTDLNEQQQAAAAGKAKLNLVFEVEILIDGEQHTDLNGGKATISIPYTPEEGESPRQLTVWYLRDDGMLFPMGGYYDEETACFVFVAKSLPLHVS